MPRDLTVRVRADVGAYQRAMRDASKSTSEFARAGTALQRKGLQISKFGDTLTKRVTLPLALAGGAAIKMAGDFDKSFVQMQTLAGVSADEVDGLKDSVLGLAGETGRAPQELAEALYFLQSSGLDSAQAMEALEVSAKASAVGLGDTATVADAVSSAMLAYADSGLEAAEATDILIATARAGKAEPAELAGQMGRLLPIASELGITFGDVGGAIAALSTKGNNAEQATTQLVNVMSKLLKPSQQAAELLEEVGLSTDGIRQMIADRGLLGTLEELRARLGESGFIKYLEDTQAVQGALSLLGGDLSKTKDIIAEVNDAAGATESAFATWAESMGAQNAQAFAQFQVALIKVGEVLAPIASDVLSFVAQIAEAFSALPGPVQTAVIAFAAFAAALGPIMSAGGQLLKFGGTLMKMLADLAVPAGSVGGTLVNHLGPGFTQVGTSAATAATGVSRLSTALKGLAIVGAAGIMAELIALNNQRFPGITNLPRDIEKITAAVREMNEADPGDPEAIRNWTLEVGNLDDALEKVLETSPGLAESLIDSAEAAGIPSAKIAELRARLEEHRTATADAQAANAEWNASLSETGGAAEEAASALQEYSDALKAMFDPLFAAVDAQVANAEAMAAADKAAKDLATAIRDHGAGSAEAAEAQAAYEAANRAVAKSAVDESAALAALGDAVRAGDVSVEDAIATLQGFVASGNLTEAAARQMAAEFGATKAQADTLAAGLDNTTGSAKTLGAQKPQVRVSEKGNDLTQRQLNETRQAAASIPTSRRVTVTASDRASGTIRMVQRQVNALTGKTITITTRLVQYSVPSYQTFGGGQAAGGPVSASKWYIVGENGPEAFVPNQDGYIVPNHAMGTVPSSSWGGGGMGGGSYVDNRTINITTGADPQAVVAALRRAGDMGLPITIRGRSL